jgi:hypothetical protein
MQLVKQISLINVPDQERSLYIRMSRQQYFPKPIWPAPEHPRSTNPKAMFVK